MKRAVPFINGRPLQQVGSWEGMKYSYGWPFGSLAASWQMRDQIRHPLLHLGALVTLYLGGVPIWRGMLLEPGRDGRMTAVGLWEEAKGAVTLTAAGATTAEPRDATVQAIARGALRWAGPVPDIYPGAAAQQVDAPYPAQMLSALLDTTTSANGTRWAIHPFSGRLITAADPTAPSWRVPHLVAGSGLTPADDSTATHLIGEYLDGPGSLKVTPAVVSPDYIQGAPRIEKHVDLTDKGYITQAKAITFLTGMYGQGVGKVGWADGLQLRRGDVLKIGGNVADPAAVAVSVATGTMLRLDGVWDDRAAAGPTGFTDIVASEAEYDETTDTVQVKPVGLQARTLKEAMTWTNG